MVPQTADVEILKIADLFDLLFRGPPAVNSYPYSQSWATLCSTPAVVSSAIGFIASDDRYADWEKIIHTTGSTGKPKLVPISHSMLAATDAHRVLSQKDPRGIKCQLEILSGARTVYVAFPLFHVAGFVLSSYLLFSGTTLMLGYPNQPPNISMLRIALKDPFLDGALLPPSLVEDVSNDSGLMEHISKLSWIYSGGGSIGQKEGDAIVTKTRLFNGIGSTECGSFIQYPTDPSNWNYFHFHPSNGIYWRSVSPETDTEITEFELVIRREESCAFYQSVFHNFPSLDHWSTKDVFRKHPTIEDLWEYRYRIDDIIVFSTGEKVNPVPLESRLSGVSGINAALAFGNKQRYPGLLLELEDANHLEQHYSSLPSELRDLVRTAVSAENTKSTRDGHIHESMIIIASKGKPFVRTPKGTIHRNMTLESYSTEIDALYRSLDIPSLSNLDQVRLNLTSEGSLARGLTDLIAKLISNIAPLTENGDIFAAGLDSGQAQILTVVINKRLAFQWEEDGGTRPTLEISAIYANPTPRRLARSILQEASSSLLEKEAEFHDILHRHLSDIPTSTVCSTAKFGETNGKHVLLTGTSGFIGSHVLEVLLRQKGLNQITCLNRELPSSMPWSQTFTRVDTMINCEHMEADLAKRDLGLPESVYHALLDSVTDILHCQWAVDFNRPLRYFEPNITGVNNLIRFACDAKHNAQIVFLSSVATVKNWKRPGLVPEVKLESYESAQMGYGQSKLIASLLLDQASERANIPTTICRLGQVAGFIKERRKGHAQTWPRRDWFPTLLTTSIKLGCIPNSLGSANEIDWIPVDTVAQALSDLVCSSDVAKVPTNEVSHSRYYHLVNPNRTSYTGLVSFLATKLGEKDALGVIPLQEWVDRLGDQAQESGKFQPLLSGLSLLGFFEKLVSPGDQRTVVLDTVLTEQRLPVLKSIGAVSERWMGIWLEEWGLM
ncbi:unnamed protein product [Penicillium glandicola]